MNENIINNMCDWNIITMSPKYKEGRELPQDKFFLIKISI